MAMFNNQVVDIYYTYMIYVTSWKELYLSWNSYTIKEGSVSESASMLMLDFILPEAWLCEAPATSSEQR